MLWEIVAVVLCFVFFLWLCGFTNDVLVSRQHTRDGREDVTAKDIERRLRQIKNRAIKSSPRHIANARDIRDIERMRKRILSSKARITGQAERKHKG